MTISLEEFESKAYRAGYKSGYSAGVDATFNPRLRWVSVKDRLPDEYVEVLYFAVDDMGVHEIMTGHREKGKWTHCCLFYSTKILNDIVKVTHWMPLPEAPE